MLIQPHKTMEHAATITYSAAASSAVFWGLHLSDIAIIVSASCSVVGVSLQVWVAVAKVRLMGRSKLWDKGGK